ncbi:MAG: hypothetical protein PHW72_03075 [Candidatus Pacebacteria bacterium]|nr:hypothetical protein [Candidatus Paceibacterota bacterium]
MKGLATFFFTTSCFTICVVGIFFSLVKLDLLNAPFQSNVPLENKSPPLDASPPQTQNNPSKETNASNNGGNNFLKDVFSAAENKFKPPAENVSEKSIVPEFKNENSKKWKLSGTIFIVPDNYTFTEALEKAGVGDTILLNLSSGETVSILVTEDLKQQ